MGGIIQSLKSHYCRRVRSDMPFVRFTAEDHWGRGGSEWGARPCDWAQVSWENHFKCGSQYIKGVCAQRPPLPLVRVGERENSQQRELVLSADQSVLLVDQRKPFLHHGLFLFFIIAWGHTYTKYLSINLIITLLQYSKSLLWSRVLKTRSALKKQLKHKYLIIK